jgi:hypothetical protein
LKTLSTAAAATALGIDRKSLDNIFAREARYLLTPGARGRSRRIPISALERAAVALILSRDVGITIKRALDVAEKILDASGGRIELGPLATIVFDVSQFRIALQQSVYDALESVAEAPRGRPRHH